MKEFIFNNCICTNVVDGDTMDVAIDVGFNFSTEQRLRLYGINTPERGKHGYLEATRFVAERCYNHEIQIITYTKDSFGRWLSIVFVQGENLNDLLLKKGLAVEYVPH